MGDFSPLLMAGVYVPTFSENPGYVNAWVEANDFPMGGEAKEAVWCNKMRFDMYAGWPMEMSLYGDIDIDITAQWKKV